MGVQRQIALGILPALRDGSDVTCRVMVYLRRTCERDLELKARLVLLDQLSRSGLTFLE